MLVALDALSGDWPDGALHIEHFSAVSTSLDPSRERSFEVALEDSGLTITVGNDQTLLEALTLAGVDVPCDCNEGLCGTCEVEVLSGEIDHRDKVLSSSERAGGKRMMACCSRSKAGKLRLAL